MVPFTQVAAVAVWGGLLALERRAFLQAMASRPLVAAVGTGWILGDIGAGTFIGMVFELFHVGSSALGGSTPDHETLPAIGAAAAAGAAASVLGSPSTPAEWSLAILLFAPLGPLGQYIEQRLDSRAQRYVTRAMNSTDLGEFRRASRQNLLAMMPHFVAFGLISGICVIAGSILGPLQELLPDRVERGLAWACPAIAAVCAAAAIRASNSRRSGFFAGVGIAATLIICAFVFKWERPW